MAFQAALSIAIAELISLSFQFERGYWITLTAMALTTQTWGESVKRSFERVGMTILGGIVGTALYFFLPDNGHIPFICLLVFIFFTVYLMPIYHLVAVFFLTCFVVFLFALIGNWDWDMLRARILDTALGAGIAMTVGFFLFPIKTDVRDVMVGYLQKMKALMVMVFQTKQIRSHVSGKKLLTEFHEIKKNALVIRYELLFHRLNLNEFNRVLDHMGRCTQYITNLIESYQWLFASLDAEKMKIVQNAAKTTAYNIKVLIDHLQKKQHANMIPASKVAVSLANAIEEQPQHFASLESDALGFFSLMYFFTELNKALNEVYVIFCKNRKDECLT